MFWSKLCKSGWNWAWDLAFLVFISPIVWNMCENLHYEWVSFKELHNEQEYCWPTIFRAGVFLVEKFKFFSLFVFGENKTKNRIIGFSYLFKTPEQTSPVRSSLAVQEADYKSKAVHRLSELVTIKSFEAMRACALFKRFYYLP